MPTSRSRGAAIVAIALALSVAPQFASADRPPVVRATLRTLAALAVEPARTVRTLRGELAGADRIVGVTWQRDSPRRNPTVRFRWHTGSGWTSWRTAGSDSAAPNRRERATARPGTEPLWRPTGADRVEVRVRSGASPVTDVRLLGVGDAIPSPVQQVIEALRPELPTAEATTGIAHLGSVYTRADWGADESMRRCGPNYASTVRAVVVHHTAQPNDYSAADVPALIRADYAYHVRGRGWCDLGYNLVVDRFGQIWQGRYGGIARAVVGAHAEGFNTGTLGVVFLGTTDNYAPSSAVVAAMGRVAGFAGATWHFNPNTHVTLTSGGSPRYRAGARVRLWRVMGHRDVGPTDCPGRNLYADLGRIRRLASGELSAPRFTSVTVEGDPVHAPTPFTVRLDLNHRARWSVVLRDTAGATLAAARGHGRVATLSWDGMADLSGTGVRAPVAPQDLTWTARAHNPDGHARRTGPVTVGLPVI